ncbi:phosphoglycolate phosphatase [Streptomyces sp. NPDC048324]|uniref:HAD family hydrolase n=1 Tax=Streptomyces sp. NPDC048324 TaxID=3157205 RepID=UPI003435D3DD
MANGLQSTRLNERIEAMLGDLQPVGHTPYARELLERAAVVTGAKTLNVTEAHQVLVLWDIDRTLLYVGDIDRQVYRETFAEIVGRPAEHLPARGTGVTMPLAIRALLLDNGVQEQEVPELLPMMIRLLPKRLAGHSEDLRREGVIMPGAATALSAVNDHPDLVPTVVTGNLMPNALLKLDVFNLSRFVDAEIGGYASDSDHRPALVAIAQERAATKRSSHLVSLR